MREINLKTLIEFIIEYKEITIPTFTTFILSILEINEIKNSSKIKNSYTKIINDIAGITATHNIFNIQVPGTKNIIDMVTIHPSGIYLINKIEYEGKITGTIFMDEWEIDTPDNKTHIIKNPIKEMKNNENIIKSMINENIYPVIIFKNKTSCHVLDGWINDNLMLIKEYEQEKIFENKEYVISYIRAEDIFENMKQFQTRRKKYNK